jgi:bacterial/archaeal transporter family protein
MTTTLLSVLLGVVGMLGWGVYDFLGGVLAKRIGAFGSLFWSQLAGAAAIVAIATVGVVLNGWLAVLSLPALVLVPVASGLYCAGYLFFFRGFEKGNVSIVAATMNLWAVVTMVVAYVFMGQRLTTTQTIGAVAIIAGAMLASINWPQLKHQGFALSLGVKETLLGAFFFGVFWNVSEVISEDIGWLMTTVLIKLGITVLLPLAAFPRRETIAIQNLSTRTAAVLAVMGAIEVSAVAAVNYGLTIGQAILITPIASALSVVTIALAILVLRDRISTLQGAGLAMAVAGIVTTAL